MKPLIPKIAAVILTLFALTTLFMSGSVIFDLFDIRARQGNYVPFIVITNFACGFLYLTSAYGLYARIMWTTHVLVAAAGILIVSFLGLLVHISSGGAYEEQTVKAMIFRIIVTASFAGIAWRYVSKVNRKEKHI